MEDKKQVIKCTVGSCEYNDKTAQKCELNGIIVTPCKNCNSGKAEDESMCGSYKCDKK